MIQSRLNDAAITLGEVLRTADIKYGIFGGYGVNRLGDLIRLPLGDRPKKSRGISLHAMIPLFGPMYPLV